MATIKVSVRLVPFGSHTLEQSYKAAEQLNEPDKTMEEQVLPKFPAETNTPVETPVVYGPPVVTFD